MRFILVVLGLWFWWTRWRTHRPPARDRLLRASLLERPMGFLGARSGVVRHGAGPPAVDGVRADADQQGPLRRCRCPSSLLLFTCFIWASVRPW